MLVTAGLHRMGAGSDRAHNSCVKCTGISDAFDHTCWTTDASTQPQHGQWLGKPQNFFPCPVWAEYKPNQYPCREELQKEVQRHHQLGTFSLQTCSPVRGQGMLVEASDRVDVAKEKANGTGFGRQFILGGVSLGGFANEFQTSCQVFWRSGIIFGRRLWHGCHSQIWGGDRSATFFGCMHYMEKGQIITEMEMEPTRPGLYKHHVRPQCGAMQKDTGQARGSALVSILALGPLSFQIPNDDSGRCECVGWFGEVGLVCRGTLVAHGTRLATAAKNGVLDGKPDEGRTV